MSFLPIVQRELRAAAHRRSTFRVRWWTTLFALALTIVSLLLLALSRGRGVGNPLFNFLTGYAFLMVLLAGVFLTSDTLAEEKRDGTLGLLFLTDLKGYDVVLGKFIAHSLNAFYCLLALLPVTAFPILLGGVEGAEFWRMALALANALFFSLAAGISVSAFMRDSQRAMGNTLGLLLLLVVALPVLKELAPLRMSRFWGALAWVSPFYPFRFAAEMLYARHAGAYWGSLAASQLLGWLFLAIASFVLPRMVQERRAVGTKHFRRQLALARPANRLPLSRSRAALLSANPIQWLRRDEIGFPWLAWLIVLASLVTVALVLLFGPADSPWFLGEFTRPFGFLLKMIFAAQACHFFVEARRNGALELLLCTPLTDREIIRGQIKALWRAFAWPIGFFAAGLLASFLLTMIPAAVSQHANFVLAGMGSVFLSALYFVRLGVDLLAILWFGMGLALTSRKPALAPALTILFVLILPAPLSFSFCFVDILIDLIFISWGTNKCRLSLRRLIAEQYQIRPAPVLMPAPPVLQFPPVILAR